MAIQTIPYMWVPSAILPGGFVKQNSTIDAAGEKDAFIIQVPKTGTLEAVAFQAGAVSANSTIDVIFQNVSTSTGDPDGTNDEFVSMDPTANAWNTSGTLLKVAAKRSVTRGELLAIILQFTDGSIVTEHVVGNDQPFIGRYPYFDENRSGAWTKRPYHPGIALKYDDGNYYPIAGCFPISDINEIRYTSSGNPDEYALRFTVPAPVRVAGWWAYLDVDAAMDVVLYDSTSSVLESTTLDSDIRVGTAASYHSRLFATSVSLSANTVYRLAFKPTTASEIGIQQLVVNSAAVMAAFPPGASWYESKRTDAGSWTDTVTNRPNAGLILDGLEDGV